MQADIIRKKFLDFFRAKKHKIVESDSLVPRDDPTVLFTPAGMNQFKKEFLGFNSGFRRAATCQRCLRTDDLDKVGKTGGHHTFFEMLGNFSFGDYFKKEAISWSWEFLSEELKVKKDKLWVSVYKEDDEAYKIWKEKIKIPAERIIKLGDKENFWPSEAKKKGPNGPCGPCSEIFFDQGSSVGCKKPDCQPSCACGRFVEVWNLVFTQFNRKGDGILEPLPKKNIDTGMGLERLSSIMQVAPNNFETDLFKPIIEEIKQGFIPKGTLPAKKELIYAVSDHIRAIAFAIYDGVLPSNETRGYVVRKLIRKSTLHLKTLGSTQPFLYKLVPVLAQIMGASYPELQERKENIAEIILAEEKSFTSTLDSSDALFNEKFSGLIEKLDSETAGILAFDLYDTHGIPLELTKDWLSKQNVKFYEAGCVDLERVFNKELEKQKNRSKLQSTMKGDLFAIKGFDYGVKETKFIGYKALSTKAKIIKIIKDSAIGGNSELKKIEKDEQATIVLDKSVFYPESGGQVGDTGEFTKGKSVFTVLDTKKVDKVILHIGKVKAGSFKKSDFVLSRINSERRISVARNHTATHLLQAALRKVLGGHVKQQGSLVAEDRLRFDFTHFKDIEKRELDRIEQVVNTYIINNYKLAARRMPLSEAKKSGALAFFGEKYDSKVRVVSAGDISCELCAGTHLDNTGQIGLFKITQELSVASQVRRIEAITGVQAYKAIKEQENIIAEVSAKFNVPADKIIQELNKRINRVKELEKQLNGQKFGALKTTIDNDINSGENLNGIYFITHIDDNVNSVRKAVDLIKEKVKENAVIVSTTGTNLGTQVFFATGITADLCDKGLDAHKLIKEIASEIGGSGGGRKDFAQAGGNRPENYKNALQKLKNIISGLKI